MKMADSYYDAIVVGGGHHGLITACYLEKAGMNTAIFEIKPKLGGMRLKDRVATVTGLLRDWERFFEDCFTG